LGFSPFTAFSATAEQGITELAHTAEKAIPLVAFPYSLRPYVPHSVWDRSRGRKLGGNGERKIERHSKGTEIEKKRGVTKCL